METNAPDNSPPATREKHRAGAGIAVVAVIVALAFVVSLVLPGFLAAWFSRGNDQWVFCMDGDPRWDLYAGSSSAFNLRGPELLHPVGYRAELIVLAPSAWLMKYSGSESVRRFYSWEFHLAGGRDVLFEKMPRPSS
jgi:hypothetical protein